MSCNKSTNKKYLKRPGPPYPAQECQGRFIFGNDGMKYVSRSNKNGVYRWFKVDIEKSIKKSSRKSSRKSVKKSSRKSSIKSSRKSVKKSSRKSAKVSRKRFVKSKNINFSAAIKIVKHKTDLFNMRISADGMPILNKLLNDILVKLEEELKDVDEISSDIIIKNLKKINGYNVILKDSIERFKLNIHTQFFRTVSLKKYLKNLDIDASKYLSFYFEHLIVYLLEDSAYIVKMDKKATINKESLYEATIKHKGLYGRLLKNINFSF